MGPRILVALALLTPFAAAETWATLAADWNAALVTYASALAKTTTRAQAERIPHPYQVFRSRLKRYARKHANTPAAAPALVAIARGTRDADERVQTLVQLRENHLRSKHLVRVIPRLLEVADPECVRTLRDIVEGQAAPAARAAAGLALRELRFLIPGKPAPQTLGDDAEERAVLARRFLGRVLIVLVAAKSEDAARAAKRLEALLARRPDEPLAVVSVHAPQRPAPRWTTLRASELAARKWNAVNRSRTFVYDHNSKLAAKDPYPGDLEKLLDKLTKAARPE